MITQEDIDYRVRMLREVWQQDRALQGNLAVNVDRVTWFQNDGDAAAGLAGTKISAPGFPKAIPAYFRNYTLREIGQAQGAISEEDREIVIFDTSADRNDTEWVPRMTDIVEASDERWHVKSITRNIITKILRISVSPVPVVQEEQR